MTTSLTKARSVLRASVAIAAAVAVMGSAAPASAMILVESSATSSLPTMSLAAQPAAYATGTPTMYTVASGDYLSKIANDHGLPSSIGWQMVYDANAVIEHPDVIIPGTQIRIPAPYEQLPHRPLPTPPPTPVSASSGSGAASSSSGSSGTTSSSSSSSSSAGGGVWDQLAQCESSGNWSSTVGTYDGGLQFLASTWKAYGGGQYAPTADQATKEQQIAIAERVLAGQGWGAWPACSSKLGLR